MNYEDVINVAWNIIGKARAKHYTPRTISMGFSLFFGLRAYLLSQHNWVYDDQPGHETLFGLPIKLTENDKYGLSIELEEFSQDFEGVIDE